MQVNMALEGRNIPEGKGRSTIIGLDFLRLAAALLVVCFHYFYYASIEPAGVGGVRDAIGAAVQYTEAVSFTWWGWVGAELFFVISGFVITMSALQKSATDFAIDRAARLLPALVVFATLSFVVVAAAGLLPFGDALIRWVKAIILFPSGPWIDGVIWTLTVELVFYIAIFSVLATGQLARLPLLMRLAAVVIGAFWLLVTIDQNLTDLGKLGSLLVYIRDTYMFRVALITTGSFFLLGMFAYEVHTRGLTYERAAYIALTTLCSLAAIIATAARSPAVVDGGHSVFVPALAWLFCCALCAASIAYERRHVSSQSLRRTARSLGLVTYPLYLVHNIAGGWLLGMLLETGVKQWFAAVITIVICMVLSYGFAVYLENALRKVIAAHLQQFRGRFMGLDKSDASTPLARV